MGQEDYSQFRRGKIKLFSRMKLRALVPGEWESVYAGDGIEFAAIRPYEPGDDLRELDLHTLAQCGEEEIIERVVERQRRVFIWVDFSGSMQRSEQMFFAQKPWIRDIATGLLLFSACKAYSPVGLYGFNRAVQRFFPAKSGEKHCWEIVNWIISEDYRGALAPAAHAEAVAFLLQRVPRQSLVFFISDFQDQAFEGDFADLLKPVIRNVDFVPIVVRDPLETTRSLPRTASVVVRDSEGDRHAEIRLTPHKLREIQRLSTRHLRAVRGNLRRLGIDHVVLDSPSIEGCHQALSAFFGARRRLRR